MKLLHLFGIFFCAGLIVGKPSTSPLEKNDEAISPSRIGLGKRLKNEIKKIENITNYITNSQFEDKMEIQNNQSEKRIERRNNQTAENMEIRNNQLEERMEIRNNQSEARKDITEINPATWPIFLLLNNETWGVALARTLPYNFIMAQVVIGFALLIWCVAEYVKKVTGNIEKRKEEVQKTFYDYQYNYEYYDPQEYEYYYPSNQDERPQEYYTKQVQHEPFQDNHLKHETSQDNQVQQEALKSNPIQHEPLHGNHLQHETFQDNQVHHEIFKDNQVHTENQHFKKQEKARGPGVSSYTSYEPYQPL